ERARRGQERERQGCDGQPRVQESLPVPRMYRPTSAAWRCGHAIVVAAAGQSGVRVRLGSSRRLAVLTIHALPDGRRRPMLVMAFGGWNDAAEAATTAARYLATAFHAEKFAEIDPEEFYHFGLSRPHVRFKAGSE